MSTSTPKPAGSAKALAALCSQILPEQRVYRIGAMVHTFTEWENADKNLTLRRAHSQTLLKRNVITTYLDSSNTSSGDDELMAYSLTHTFPLNLTTNSHESIDILNENNFYNARNSFQVTFFKKAKINTRNDYDDSGEMVFRIRLIPAEILAEMDKLITFHKDQFGDTDYEDEEGEKYEYGMFDPAIECGEVGADKLNVDPNEICIGTIYNASADESRRMNHPLTTQLKLAAFMCALRERKLTDDQFNHYPNITLNDFKEIAGGDCYRDDDFEWLEGEGFFSIIVELIAQMKTFYEKSDTTDE